MITWTLTADEISSVFAANDTLTPGATIAAGGAEDRAAAAAEACEAISPTSPPTPTPTGVVPSSPSASPTPR